MLPTCTAIAQRVVAGGQEIWPPIGMVHRVWEDLPPDEGPRAIKWPVEGDNGEMQPLHETCVQWVQDAEPPMRPGQISVVLQEMLDRRGALRPLQPDAVGGKVQHDHV